MITEVANGMSCEPILRDQVRAIEAEMRKLPQAKLPLNHYQIDNVYVRELVIPKDACIVGKIHKYDHVLMIIKGDLSFSVDNKVERRSAPFIMKSSAGAKRVIYAHDDSIMVTVHSYDGDVENVDEYLVFEKESDWLEFNKRQPMLAL